MNRKLVSKSNNVLKRILSCESTNDILIDFIESMLMCEVENIKRNEREEDENYNYGVVDVRVKLKGGSDVNVGIQFIDGLYYASHKMLIYYAKINSKQEDDGDTKTINILDFKYTNDEGYVHELLVCKERNIELKKSFGIYYVELPKFNKDPKKIVDKKEALVAYLKGYKLDFTKEKFEKILKLDNMLNKYWLDEKIE